MLQQEIVSFFFIFKILRKPAVSRWRPLLMIVPVTNYRKHNQAFPLFPGQSSPANRVTGRGYKTGFLTHRLWFFSFTGQLCPEGLESFCWGREIAVMQLHWLPRAKSIFLSQIILSLADSPKPMHII